MSGQKNFMKGDVIKAKKSNRLRRLLSHISRCFGFKIKSGWVTTEFTFGRKKSKNSK